MVASSVADVGAEGERRTEAQVDYDGGPRHGGRLPRDVDSALRCAGVLWFLHLLLRRLRSGRSRASGGVFLGFYAVWPVVVVVLLLLLLLLLRLGGRREISHHPPPQLRVLLGSAGDHVRERRALEQGSGRSIAWKSRPTSGAERAVGTGNE